MKIAILGYGTIGSGVYEIFGSNAAGIRKKAGDDIDVKYVLDLRDFPGDPVEKKIVHDFRIIAEDPEISCVVETMGGVEPAYSFVKELLLRGKSVCTSNKELVAKHGAELLEIARQKKENFFFEAAVGGAIPVIRPINESFSSDEIVEICGIVNGTTNYILTKMCDDGEDFSTALAEAQEKGYAERNPEADVEGHDACRKIAILSSLACGSHVNYEKIYTEGITKLTTVDLGYARKLGKAIKLIAQMRKEETGVFATVSPMLVGNGSPLFAVNGVYNGILIKGRFSGQIMFYGSGAGKLPTAAAVSADVVECARNAGKNEPVFWSGKELQLADRMEEVNDFFVRVHAGDADKVREVFDKITEVAPAEGEFAFTIKKISERDFIEKLKGIRIINRIRILNI
jgi:homoserine dehydrogenase